MRGIQKQKTGRKSTPRNRYYAGAKLSEHKFLRVLQGYADGATIRDLEPTTHVSGKTIRTTYRVLRTALPLAIQQEPACFAEVGTYLFENGIITENGERVLAALRRSKRFRRYIQRHSPRLRNEKDEQLFLLEKTTRIFCALDLRDVEVDATRLYQLSEGILELRPADPLQRLADFIAQARPHAHPMLRLYEGYRRYLLAHPL